MKECISCKSKRLGCTKFCDRYRSSYEDCIRAALLNIRIARREEEIFNRILRRDINEEQ